MSIFKHRQKKDRGFGSPGSFAVAVALGVLLPFAASATSHGAVVLVPDIEVDQSQREVDVPILLSGGDELQNLSIAFSIGDGGPLLGGIETIEIIGVRYQGETIFDGFNLLTFEGVDLPARGATIANAVINQAATDTTAGATDRFSTAMVFRLDLGTAELGERLSLNPNAGGLSQASNSRGEIIPLSFVTGTLSVTAVPEANSLYLLAAVTIVSAFLVRRRWPSTGPTQSPVSKRHATLSANSTPTSPG
jgi:hypothetical protein